MGEPTNAGPPGDERRAVAALIDRLVRESKLPSDAAREELRRELESHFAEAGDSPEALRAALARFGSADAVSEGFRRAYGRGRLALYAAKVVASAALSAAVAVAVHAVVSLRIEQRPDALRLVAGGHPRGAQFTVVVALVAVAAWELGIEPLCARLERRPVGLAAALAATFVAIYSTHLALHDMMDAGRAFVASAAVLAVWACAIAIVARIDLAFLDRLGTRDR